MKIWLIVILFLVAMFIDGIIFPAFFGFRESFLTIIFFIIMLMCYKTDFRGLVFGMILSGLAEFYWGLRFGALILPLFASAGAFFLLNIFFNIRNRILTVLSGIILFIVFWETSILINRII